MIPSASPHRAIPHPGTRTPRSCSAGTAPRSPAAAGMPPTAQAAVWATLFSSRVSLPEASAKTRTEAVIWPPSQKPVFSPTYRFAMHRSTPTASPEARARAVRSGSREGSGAEESTDRTVACAPIPSRKHPYVGD